jgi:hypothetical protein
VPRATLLVHLIADADRSTGIVAGDGQIDAPALTAATAHATIREVNTVTITGQQRRFPSAALADYIRARDLTCRFPGCDVPAWNTDIDHTVPYPAGPTHPSNLKCLSRAHHLLKTFHDGWTDTQLPGATIVWTSPTGHVYTTERTANRTRLNDKPGSPPTTNPHPSSVSWWPCSAMKRPS